MSDWQNHEYLYSEDTDSRIDGECLAIFSDPVRNGDRHIVDDVYLCRIPTVNAYAEKNTWVLCRLADDGDVENLSGVLRYCRELEEAVVSFHVDRQQVAAR